MAGRTRSTARAEAITRSSRWRCRSARCRARAFCAALPSTEADAACPPRRWAGRWRRPAASLACPRSTRRSAPRRSRPPSPPPAGCRAWACSSIGITRATAASTISSRLSPRASARPSAANAATRKAAGLEFVTLRGAGDHAPHWAAFYKFYTSTVDRKWGSAYLTSRFFPLLSERLGDAVVLMLAMKGGTAVAGALNLMGVGRAVRPQLGLPAATTRSCISSFAITRRSTSPSPTGWPGSRPAPRANTRSSAAICPAPTFSAHWIDHRRAAGRDRGLPRPRTPGHEARNAGPGRNGPVSAGRRSGLKP